VPEYVEENGIEVTSNEQGTQLILDYGKEVLEREINMNPMKGVKGTFYREHRREDLLEVVKDVLKVRKSREKERTRRFNNWAWW
jgi:hypothetical protein